eukprot:2798172-Rhodomonas_salina.2
MSVSGPTSVPGPVSVPGRGYRPDLVFASLLQEPRLVPPMSPVSVPHTPRARKTHPRARQKEAVVQTEAKGHTAYKRGRGESRGLVRAGASGHKSDHRPHAPVAVAEGVLAVETEGERGREKGRERERHRQRHTQRSQRPSTAAPAFTHKATFLLLLFSPPPSPPPQAPDAPGREVGAGSGVLEAQVSQRDPLGPLSPLHHALPEPVGAPVHRGHAAHVHDGAEEQGHVRLVEALHCRVLVLRRDLAHVLLVLLLAHRHLPT